MNALCPLDEDYVDATRKGPLFLPAMILLARFDHDV